MSTAPERKNTPLRVTPLPRPTAGTPLVQRLGFRVLQTSHAPAQMSLFQRPNGR
jgi:hypothetical protein